MPRAASGRSRKEGKSRELPHLIETIAMNALIPDKAISDLRFRCDTIGALQDLQPAQKLAPVFHQLVNCDVEMIDRRLPDFGSPLRH
jgi:hypothetical protein